MNSWIDVIINQCKKDGNKIAFLGLNYKVTYNEFLINAYKYSLFLKNNIKNNEDKVMIVSKRNAVFFEVFAATLIAGLIFVPLEEKVSETRVEYYKNKLGNVYFFNNYEEIILDDINLSVDEIINSIDIDPHAIGQILFTSGSSSEPKGVVLDNLYFTRLATPKENFNDNMGILICHPVNHLGGIYLALSVLNYGGSVSYIDNAFDFDGFFTYFEKYGLNSISVTPSILKVYLSMCGEDLKTLPLRYVYVGGEYCSLKLKQEFYNLMGFNFLTFYGSTECGIIACNLDEKEDYCLGYLFDDKKAKIIDGEIVINGQYLMKRYFGMDDINGEFYTNDLGYIKDDKLYYSGRKDNIINCGGIKISPLEIEQVTLKNDKIFDCLCLGKKDDEFGYIVVLFYVGDINEKDIKKYLEKHLELNKIPREINKIEEFVKNKIGKKDLKYYKDLLNN